MVAFTKIISGQRVTFVLDDAANAQHCTEVLNHGTAWVKGSILTLQRAIDYSTKALITPHNVAEQYWEFLGLCFGLPRRNGRGGEYKDDVNEIIAVLNKALIGMSGDLTIADISQMPMLAKLTLKCMDPLGDPQDKLAGLVFADALEMTVKYLKNIMSSVPQRVKKTELSGHIHLHFDRLLKSSGRCAVVTLIHEATHKFAATTDEQYFPDEKTPGTAFSEMITMFQTPPKISTYDKFEDLVDDARATTIRIGNMGEATRNLQKMQKAKAMNNADSYANFALDVGDLPTAEETNRVIARLLGSSN